MEFRGNSLTRPLQRTWLRGCAARFAAIALALSAAASAHAAPAAEDETAALLAAAASAMAREQYVYPASGSAMALYHEVLVLDPDNAQARLGLEKLVEHFLEQASRATEARRYFEAQSMISRARMVDPSNPNIEPLALELRLLENAQRHRVTLDWRKVAARSSELAPILRELGSKARQPQCRAIISVSSDAEGRWIYQQLSRAPGERRIAAQVRIESPAAVEVLCLVTDNND